MTPLQKQYYKWILTRNFRELNKVGCSMTCARLMCSALVAVWQAPELCGAALPFSWRLLYLHHLVAASHTSVQSVQCL